VSADDELEHLARRDYDEMGLARLRAIAASLEIDGRSRMTKPELAFAIVAERRLRGLAVGDQALPSVDMAAITEQPLRSPSADAQDAVAGDAPATGDSSHEPTGGHSPSELVASAKAILAEYEPSALK
jgi:hypothetical protein